VRGGSGEALKKKLTQNLTLLFSLFKMVKKWLPGYLLIIKNAC